MSASLHEIAEASGLLYQVQDHIALITINRPERGNAMNGKMGRALRQIWADVRENNDIRVAIFTAMGEKAFCTGGDVDEISDGPEDTALVNRPFHDAVYFSAHQNRVMKPVICAVNGLVNAGGLHFVVDADIVVASENATFMDSHTNVGLVGGIENVGLMKRLPIGTALRMTLQGKNFRLKARRAYELGMVDELVATPADLLPAAIEIAKDIAANSPQAVALSKQALWHSLETGYSHACENGWNLVRLHWAHPDFSEGPKAFQERRAPVWNPDLNAGNKK
jgi:E-phenylitaconyl-CoA hydratase